MQHLCACPAPEPGVNSRKINGDWHLFQRRMTGGEGTDSLSGGWRSLNGACHELFWALTDPALLRRCVVRQSAIA